MQIGYKKRFQKNFLKLPPKLQNLFYEKLEIFIGDKFDGRLNNHSVSKAFPGCRSINITGDYRAIFYQDGESVIFITIDTHSELYG